VTPAELKQARKALGLTQHRMAEALGYTDRNVICRKERGLIPVQRSDVIIIGFLLEKHESRKNNR